MILNDVAMPATAALTPAPVAIDDRVCVLLCGRNGASVACSKDQCEHEEVVSHSMRLHCALTQ